MKKAFLLTLALMSYNNVHAASAKIEFDLTEIPNYSLNFLSDNILPAQYKYINHAVQIIKGIVGCILLLEAEAEMRSCLLLLKEGDFIKPINVQTRGSNSTQGPYKLSASRATTSGLKFTGGMLLVCTSWEYFKKVWKGTK